MLVSDRNAYRNGDDSSCAGGLGVVSTPRDSPESGGGRVYALKSAGRAGIPLAGSPHTGPSRFASPAVCLSARGTGDARDETGGAEARECVRRPPVSVPALLSMGHKPSFANKPLRVWDEGSRVDVPAIISLRPSKGENLAPGNTGKRGKVSTFSNKSRRNLSRTLGTMIRAEESYTMALTLPGDLGGIEPVFALECFAKLSRRFTANPAFATVSAFWKRELQNRGAVHWHLLVYGVSDPFLREKVRGWLVTQWNGLICERSPETAREHHRWWHARAENFAAVKDMANYFAKYIGKDPDVTGALPGRWWGSWNKKKLPVAECRESDQPESVKVAIHRVFRKLRANRMNEGKHRAITARAWQSRSPFADRPLSRWDIQRLRMGYTPEGRNPRFARFILACIEASAKHAGLRYGKARFKGNVPNTASMVLLGAGMPDVARRLLEWVASEYLYEMGDFSIALRPCVHFFEERG